MSGVTSRSRGPPITVESVSRSSTGALFAELTTSTEAATSTAASNDSAVYRPGRRSSSTTV